MRPFFLLSTLGVLGLNALQTTVIVNATGSAISNIANLLEMGINQCDTVCIGGNGGAPFRYHACDDGEFIKSIDVWASFDTIRAIQMTFPKKQFQRGIMEGSKRSFAFQPGEYLTALSIWGNGYGTRTGYITFKTNLGNKFEHGMSKRKGDEYIFNVHSGYVCGMFGSSGVDIDRFGMYFLPKIKSALLHSFKYPDMNRDFAKVPIVIGGIDLKNQGSVTQNIDVANGKEVTEVEEWTYGGALELGIKDFIKIGGHGAKKGLSTKTNKITFGTPLVIPPHTHMVAEYVVYQQVINTRYDGILTLHFENGKSLDFKAQGEYHKVTGNEVTSVVKEVSGPGIGLPYPLHWRKCSNDEIPNEIYPYGTEKSGACLYVGRVKHKNKCYRIGKAGAQIGGCVYDYEAKEYLAKEYEVLDVDQTKVAWVTVRGGIPEGKNICPEGYVMLLGGETTEGNPTYVGRLKYKGDVIPGNVVPRGKEAVAKDFISGIVFAHSGKTWRSTDVNDFEVMCVQANFRLEVESGNQACAIL